MHQPPADPIIAFDIGGTWFRSAIVSAHDEIVESHQVPALSKARSPEASTEQLQESLVDYLISESQRLGALASTAMVGVSLGAAIDARTGRVVAASPLWGATGLLDFDIESRLALEGPDFSWSVLNDLTAAAIGASMIPKYASLRRFSILTVSSGLAMRTIEPATGYAPMSVHSGLQGEVGHLPATFKFNGRIWSRRCDCGGHDHLSSFASGRGIEATLRHLASEGCPWLLGPDSMQQKLARAVNARQPEAMELLDAITEPLARTLLAVFTIDGDVEAIALTGGVVDALGSGYMDSLRQNMSHYELYGSPSSALDGFQAIVERVPEDWAPTLRGAAAWARRSDVSSTV